MTTATVEHFPITRFLSEDSIGKLDDVQRDAISEHLKHFAIFNDTVCQCRCGRNLGEPRTVAAALGMTTFTWGLQHGEGHCYECDWPARGVHSIKVEGRETPFYFRVVLPYHPDFVESRDS